MMYDPDYDIAIESQWWSLMQYAAKIKLELKLVMRMPEWATDTCYLYVSIYDNQTLIWEHTENTLIYDTQLYYNTKRFLEECKIAKENNAS